MSGIYKGKPGLSLILQIYIFKKFVKLCFRKKHAKTHYWQLLFVQSIIYVSLSRVLSTLTQICENSLIYYLLCHICIYMFYLLHNPSSTMFCIKPLFLCGPAQHKEVHQRATSVHATQTTTAERLHRPTLVQ